MFFGRSPVGIRLAALAVAAFIALALGATGRFSAARSAPLHGAAVSRCSSPQPCVSALNAGSGVAMSGVAHHNAGIFGQTSASSHSALENAINAGIHGDDRSKVHEGKTDYSGGVLGTSLNGFGVWGFSHIEAGVIGETSNPSAQDNYVAGGVEGVDQSTDGGQSNAGVLGISPTSNGVQGITMNPSTTAQFGRAAIFGIDASRDGGRRNWGSAGFSGTGTGILGISLALPQTSGAPFASALLALCENGGPSIEAADGPLPTANLFLLADCAGNITIEGTVTTGTPPAIVTHSARGDVTAYAPREAEPTIEDAGHAQLQDGSAHVALRGDFAATIERAAGYLVFITPEGDNRGLFVNEKTPSGFDVRESANGRSSIGFSYRVVAKPRGEHEARLPKARGLVQQQAVARRSGRSWSETVREFGGVPAGHAP